MFNCLNILHIYVQYKIMPAQSVANLVNANRPISIIPAAYYHKDSEADSTGENHRHVSNVETSTLLRRFILRSSRYTSIVPFRVEAVPCDSDTRNATCFEIVDAFSRPASPYSAGTLDGPAVSSLCGKMERHS